MYIGLEVIGIAGLTFVMARLAEEDGLSPLMWAVITLGLAIGALFILPWGFARVLIAGVVSFLLMIFYKMASER